MITMMPALRKMNFWIFCWVGFVLFYGVSIKYSFNMHQWQNVIYLVQLTADILIGYLSFTAFRNRVSITEKKFYFLIFLSLIPGLFTNEIYNLIVNLPGVDNIKVGTDLYWGISYFLFLVIQIIGWLYLLIQYSKMVYYQKKYSIVLWVNPIIIILLSLMAVKFCGGNLIDQINIAGIINSFLEATLFILISVCLSRTKNNSLVTLESGFLLLIAFNIMHRVSYISGHYTKLFDAAWMLSLIVIIFGLARAYVNREEKIEFFPTNSIHTAANAVFVSFATLLFSFLVVFGFVVSSIELGKVGDHNILPQNIPAILISSYLLTLLISRLVADYVTNPLSYLHQKINLVYENKYSDATNNKKIDIFEINELEKFTLHTIQQLQIANRVKSDFLMNMSHDFRTPASGIYQMASYVHKKLETSDLSSYMKLIVDSSGQLINLLDDVLDYSRIDSDRWILTFEKFDLSAVIRDVILCLSAKVEENSLSLSYIFCAESLYYFGDKLAINRVILNLVSNAIKFTNQGSIIVTLKSQEIDYQLWAIIEIQDTGIGILPQYHKAIFEPFHRISSVENSKYPGIGLGLSNANLVVKKMKGKITVKSEIGKGSTFSICLPIKNKNDESKG